MLTADVPGGSWGVIDLHYVAQKYGYVRAGFSTQCKGTCTSKTSLA